VVKAKWFMTILRRFLDQKTLQTGAGSGTTLLQNRSLAPALAPYGAMRHGSGSNKQIEPF